jgi:hypothetical protein
VRQFGIVAVSVVALGTCAGTAAQPVAVVQPQDQYADCAAMSEEVRANNTRISELESEKALKVGQNMFLWFGANSPGPEELALIERQAYLATLAAQRHCKP